MGKSNAAKVTAVPVVEASGTVLVYRRQHPGGGPLGRCSYGIPGVPGIAVFDMGMFANGTAPASITVNLAMAVPSPRKVAGVTSAVVASANTQVAQATAMPIAPPAGVAAVASTVASNIVASAKGGAASVLQAFDAARSK
jgi:hypothetical protein